MADINIDPFAAFGAPRRASSARAPSTAEQPPANVPMNQMNAMLNAIPLNQPNQYGSSFPAQGAPPPQSYGAAFDPIPAAGMGLAAPPPACGGGLGSSQPNPFAPVPPAGGGFGAAGGFPAIPGAPAAGQPNPFAPSESFDVSSLEAALAAPPQPASADPFAGAADPFAGAADPFAGAADPFAGAADPFAPAARAAPAAPAEDDPFGAGSLLGGGGEAPPGAAAEEEEEEEDDDDDDGPAPEVAAPSLDGGGAPGAAKPTVLSRQDTWRYLEELQGDDLQKRVDAARALKSLAFNANAEYKDGLIKGGVPRLLMLILTEAPSIPAIEQSTSCMYSLAREHQESKAALVKVGALRALAAFLDHDSKQCQLNSCATLYAISCAGRDTCKQLAAFHVMARLRQLVNPGIGRSAQDDQLQLFAALLIVNLLHVKGITSKQERVSLNAALQRAYDDATEKQVRDTIHLGLKRLKHLDSQRKRAVHKVKKRLGEKLGGTGAATGAPAAPPAGGGATGVFGSSAGPSTSGMAQRPRTSSMSLAKGALGSLRSAAATAANTAKAAAKSGGRHHGSDSAVWE